MMMAGIDTGSQLVDSRPKLVRPSGAMRLRTRGHNYELPTVKEELNLDKKWQSDDLFYIIMNEIHPRFNQFCVILKLS